MQTRNIRMAIRTLRRSKWRSLMTMTGIILGVVSVVTMVSLAQGIRRQVLGQVNHLGGDLLTIRSGNVVVRDDSGTIIKTNNLNNPSFAVGSLVDSDLDTIAHTPGVLHATPLAVVSAGVRSGDDVLSNGSVIATDDSFLGVFKQELAYGNFFAHDDANLHQAVVGKRVAEELFHENVPIGLTLSIRGRDYVVVGILPEFPPAPPLISPDYNRAVLIPFTGIKELGGGAQLVQVFATPDKNAVSADLIRQLNLRLKTAHGGTNDVSILRQDENLAVTSSILTILTSFIAGIAAMSLLVGGIGIMNIMFVSVTERTREIGIRKAVGATNRQIAGQFFVEAVVLSSAGGVIGILLAYVLNFILLVTTHLEPVITWPVVIAAGLVSILLGSLFGLIPAVRAARKDPIDSLRYE